MTKVLVIPSWYPSLDHPTAGVFIYQQVQALRVHADVAVLYVREAQHGSAPPIEDEGSVPVVRRQLQMPPLATSLAGRLRAVLINQYNKRIAYPRAGLLAFEDLRRTWGTPDIIHVQALFPAAMIARAIKRRYGIPYVVTEHSEEYLLQSERRLAKYPIVVRLLLRPLAKGASRTIAVSRLLADRLVQLGLAVDPMVIPNVVPLFEPAPLPLEAPHVVNHVSVMGPAKNLGMLIEAVKRLRARRTDFALRLIGDGELRPELQRLADSLGVGGFVEFTGRKTAEEVHAMLAESAFTVVSSTHETFSVSAAESLMAGRPVLSTRCGGPEGFVTPEVGELIEAGSVDALVEGLDRMLDRFAGFDPRALHEYARERFAPDVVAAQMLAVYREVLGD